MYFYLTFQNSGDSLKFRAVYPDLIEYIDQCLASQNHLVFYPTDIDRGKAVDNKLKNFREIIKRVNQWYLILTDESYPEFDDIYDYLDQDLLNQLHAYWIKSQTQTYDIRKNLETKSNEDIVKRIHDFFPDDMPCPPLSTVIKCLGLADEYGLINTPYIHDIESFFNAFKFKLRSPEWVDWHNPFPHYVTNDVSNLSLVFNHLGRTLEDKFLNFDDKLEHDDENSFKQIIPILDLNLKRPLHMPYSREFVEWCKRHDRSPIGNCMCLGNIPDLYDNLKKYRIIISRNLLNNNGFTLQLT